MRNNLPLVTFLVCALISCEKTVALKSTDAEPVLFVNGQFMSCDSIHTLTLCISQKDGLFPLSDTARVDCYINGNLIETRDSVWLSDSLFQNHSLQARLCEGDHVKLTIKSGILKASSEVIVPEAPDIEITDTIFDKYNHKCLCAMSIRDIAEEKNYYTVMDCPGIYTLKREGITIGDKTTVTSVANVDPDDPIFVRDSQKLPAPIAELLGYEDNGFRWIFTDNLFNGNTYLLHYTIELEKLQYKWSGEEYHSEELYGGRTVLFRLGGLSEEHYRYYSYIDAIASGTPPLAEPMPSPCNIEGGIGFFGTIAVSEYRIDLPDEYLGQSP